MKTTLPEEERTGSFAGSDLQNANDDSNRRRHNSASVKAGSFFRQRRAMVFLVTRIGGWRTHLIFIAFGWALYQNGILKIGSRSIGDYINWMPWQALALSACGVLLVVFGCRLVLLLAASLTGWLHLRASWTGAHPTLEFIGEEYLLYFAVPFVGLMVFLLAAVEGVGRKRKSASDSLLIDLRMAAACRILAISTLSFAALAKLNSDFFDSATSCMFLVKDLEGWWKLPERVQALLNGMTPGAFVAMEGATIILLLLWAPLGIFYTVLFTQGLANIGPTGFNAAIVAMALGFLGHQDKEAAFDGMRRTWKISLFLLLLWIPASFSLYQGPRPWYQFGLYQAVSLVLLQMLVLIMLSRVRLWRANGTLLLSVFTNGVFHWEKIPSSSFLGNLKRVTPFRVFLLVLLMLTLLNGLSPYLGLKYRVSFAMLSNLRVDKDRWNHFFMPEWIYLFENDPYVRVNHIHSDHSFQEQDNRKNKIYQQMYSPAEFKKRAYFYADHGIPFSVELIHEGVSYRFDRALQNAEFWEFVWNLSDSRAFQAWLFYGRPQHCIH